MYLGSGGPHIDHNGVAAVDDAAEDVAFALVVGLGDYPDFFGSGALALDRLKVGSGVEVVLVLDLGDSCVDFGDAGGNEGQVVASGDKFSQIVGVGVVGRVIHYCWDVVAVEQGESLVGLVEEVHLLQVASRPLHCHCVLLAVLQVLDCHSVHCARLLCSLDQLLDFWELPGSHRDGGNWDGLHIAHWQVLGIDVFDLGSDDFGVDDDGFLGGLVEQGGDLHCGLVLSSEQQRHLDQVSVGQALGGEGLECGDLGFLVEDGLDD